MTVHTPKPNKGWRPEGTATWQRAERARQSLLAFMREHEMAQGCPGCHGQGWMSVPTPQGIPGVRAWALRVVCPHCRREDYER